MRTARSLLYGGSLSRGVLLTETPQTEIPLYKDAPGQRLPWTETPLDRDPLDRDPPDRPPWTETPVDRDSPDRDPQDPGRDPLDRDHPWDRDPLVMWPVVHAGTETPPCEQNHRQV